LQIFARYVSFISGPGREHLKIDAATKKSLNDMHCAGQPE